MKVGGRLSPTRWRGRFLASPRLLAVRLLFETSPGLAAALVAWTVVSAVTPVLFLAAGGELIAAVPAAVGAGAGAGASRQLAFAVAVTGALFVVTVILGPVHDGLRTACRVRLTFALQQRLIAAVDGPVGIAHLEEPATLARIAGAQGSLTNYFPADAPAALAAVLGQRLTGLLACLIVGWYWWWLGLLLAVLWLWVRRPLQRILLGYIAAYGGDADAMRRADYFLRLTTGNPAAKEIRIFGLSAWLLDRFRTHWHDGMRSAWSALSRYRRTVATLLLAVGPVCGVAVWIVADAAANGQISLRVFATLLPMVILAGQVGMMTMDDVQLEWMLSAVPDLGHLERDLVTRDRTPVKFRKEVSPLSEAVTFEGVGFRYPGSERPVFSKIDLVVPAGCSTAVVGANGAGKTSFVKLLCRLYEPTEGVVRVDGVPLPEFDPVVWRRRVSAVFQDFNRYPATLAENVAFGAPDHPIDQEMLAQILARVGLDGLLKDLPKGSRTLLSPRYAGGSDLSGGQWQRVALARALYGVECGAEILVLDEPTASLDVRGEADFYNRFLDLTAGTTSIVISHRFSSVRRADHIYVIDAGRVVEHGSHDELMDGGGSYSRLFRIQARRFGVPEC